MASRAPLLALVAAVAASGCAGARYAVRADDARYPISMSPALPDRDGTILYIGHGLVVLKRFSEDVRKFGFFYGATGSTLELSELVNAQVAAAGGDGVADLEIVSEHCAINWFFPLTLLPIWPGCEIAHVSGAVVKNVRQPATPAVAAAPTGAVR
jgi:hypothetical protein